jgi:hypothetical protein
LLAVLLREVPQVAVGRHRSRRDEYPLASATDVTNCQPIAAPARDEHPIAAVKCAYLTVTGAQEGGHRVESQASRFALRCSEPDQTEGATDDGTGDRGRSKEPSEATG